MGSHQIKNHLPDGRTGLVALSFGMLADIADKSPRGFEILTVARRGFIPAHDVAVAVATSAPSGSPSMPASSSPGSSGRTWPATGWCGFVEVQIAYEAFISSKQEA